jgi:hypothetical protein
MKEPFGKCLCGFGLNDPQGKGKEQSKGQSRKECGQKRYPVHVVPLKKFLDLASPFHICPCPFPAFCVYFTTILPFSLQMPVM